MKDMFLPQNDWKHFFDKETQLPYFITLASVLKEELHHFTIYPKQEDWFNAFHFTPKKQVKVVIIGQDPYHQPNQAHGLAFSVKNSKLPPSLCNIYKELQEDLSIQNTIGNLTPWAKQGVLLLNTVLTVRDSSPKSHQGLGWETFTTHVIQELNLQAQPIVYLLWGNDAKQFAKVITNPLQVCLFAPHPSPLSSYRGFFGCKHFSKASAYLQKYNLSIDWKIIT